MLVWHLFNHLLRRRLLRRRLLRWRLLLLLRGSVSHSFSDELVVVALRRRELRSQAADVGGSRGESMLQLLIHEPTANP